MLTSKISAYLKGEFRFIPLGIKLVVLVVFLRSIGWGFVDPFYSMYLQQFYENYSVVGALSALLPLASLLVIIPLMRLTDKIQDTILIRDGEALYFLVITCYILSGFLQSLPLLVITLILSGASHTLLYVGVESYIRKSDTGGKSGPFGYYITLDYLGWIIGMVIAAFLVKYYNFNSMFLFILPGVLLSFLIFPYIHERGIRSLIVGIRKYFSHKKDLSCIYNDWKEFNPKMAFFLVLTFFDGVIKMFAAIFIPLFGLSINLSLSSIALLMAAMYCPYILSYIFSKIADSGKKMTVIAVGLFIGAFAFFSLYFILNKVLVIILAACISLSLAIIRPANNGAITCLSPHRMRGEVTGLNNFVEIWGKILGPIVMGAIADIYGIQMAFLTIGMAAFVLGIISLTLHGYNYLVDGSNIMLKSEYK